MNTEKVAILAQIYNADGSISRRRIRRMLFPNLPPNARSMCVDDWEFTMPEEDWQVVLFALMPDAKERGQYAGWEYDNKVTVLEHANNFVTYVLVRMGVDPALTK